MKIILIAVSIVLGLVYICTGTSPDEPSIEVNTTIEKASDNYYYNPSKICNMGPYDSKVAMVDQLTDCLAEEREWYKL